MPAFFAQAGRYLHPVTMRATMYELAALFRACGEDAQADTLDHLADDPDENLPRRVLSLFRQGMGGMFDAALYRDGVLDREASDRRKVLAEHLVQAAKAELR
jgi:hypothetical protein